MKFYHFTSVSYAETILSKGISRGHVKHGDRSIRNSVVWLTTDPDADGHGLMTGGKTLTERDMEYLTRVDGVAPKNGIVMNKTRVRLTVEMSADTATLMPFVEYYARRGEKPDEAKLMGLSAYIENPWRLPLTRRRQLLKTTTTKEGTWWLSFAPISASEIARVEFNGPNGFVDYDFEAHGRQHFHDAGFVAPSATTLQSLHPLVPCDYPFEKAKAFAFCTDPKHDPHVVIRGGGQDCAFDVVTGAPAFGMSHPNSEALAKWVRDHSAELLDCWVRAVDVYYCYYPKTGTPRSPIRLNP